MLAFGVEAVLLLPEMRAKLDEEDVVFVEDEAETLSSGFRLLMRAEREMAGLFQTLAQGYRCLSFYRCAEAIQFFQR